MNTAPASSRRLVRNAVRLAFGAVVAFGGLPAFAAPGDPPASAAPEAPGGPGDHRGAVRGERIQRMLDRAANRLEIKASQQTAWDGFARAMRGLFEPSAAARPGRDADAATIARIRAERAAEHARRMTQVADATAALQGVLAPDQRKTFDQMAHRFESHRQGGHGWHHRPAGPGDGPSYGEGARS